MIIESFNAWSESAAKHVSTTKRKIGGEGAGRASLYSIVVAEGCSSGGIVSCETTSTLLDPVLHVYAKRITYYLCNGEVAHSAADRTGISTIAPSYQFGRKDSATINVSRCASPPLRKQSIPRPCKAPCMILARTVTVADQATL